MSLWWHISSTLLIMFVTHHTAERVGLSNKAALRVCLALIAVISFIIFATGTLEVVSMITTLVWNTPFKTFTTPTGIAKFVSEILTISETNGVQVVVFISVLYLLLQTFCIPGTVVLNSIFGAVIGVAWGVPLAVVLGGLGASSCYTLSGLMGTKFVESVDARLMKSKGLPKIRAQVQKYKSELFVYLLFLRLTPILPNWLINLASPVVGVPLVPFALATVVGIMPQTYLAVRFGTLAHLVRDGGHEAQAIVTKWDTLLLFVIAVAIVFAARLKKHFSQ